MRYPKLIIVEQNGFFLDLAANDAVTLSNTLFLEQKLAWNGICIEPNLEYYSSKTKSIVLNKGIYTQNVNNQDSDGVSLLRRKCKLVRAAVASPTNTKVRFDFGGPEKWAALGGIVGSNFESMGPQNNLDMLLQPINRLGARAPIYGII